MKIKNLIVGICVVAIALGMMAFADTEPVLISAENETGIYVNGGKLDADYIVDEAGDKFLPLRKLCEAMGFNVLWNSETNDVAIEKMPMYFTFNIYNDGYTISKTAPILLGKAPVVKDCTTYVPVSFVSDIISYDVTEKDGKIEITLPAQETKTNTVVFNSIADSMCVVYDVVLGDVLVNISNDTVVEGDIASLEKGQMLEVVYDDFMTMSLPPITNALKIKVLEGETAEILNGVITEVISEDGIKQIVAEDAEGNSIAFNVSDEKTTLLALDGSQAEFSSFDKGAKISVVASMAATRSLPPQRAAYAIRFTE